MQEARTTLHSASRAQFVAQCGLAWSRGALVRRRLSSVDNVRTESPLAKKRARLGVKWEANEEGTHEAVRL